MSLQKSRAADEKKYQSQHSQHVFETFPGIELTLFYINETFTYRFKSIWAEQKIVHTIGTVLFWQHISPLFEKIKKQIGCQYLFLFAADSSADGKLINYYSSILNLMIMIYSVQINLYLIFYANLCIKKLMDYKNTEKHSF